METNVNYTLVGAFMITLIASIIFSVIWLSSGFSLAQYRTYAIYTQESVSGLNIDSPVEYNGVNVGSVTNIELDANNPKIVKLLLGIKTNTPITTGTVAVLTTRGITGITFIALKDKSESVTPLVALKGQAYPVIQTAPSLLTRLDTALSELSTNLRQVSQSIQSVLNKDNQEAIKNILMNLQKVTGVLSDNSNKLNTILINTTQASKEFAPLMHASIGAIRMFQTQTLPATYQLLNNLDNMTRTLSEVSVEVRQNPSVLVRGVQRNNYGPGEKK